MCFQKSQWYINSEVCLGSCISQCSIRRTVLWYKKCMMRIRPLTVVGGAVLQEGSQGRKRRVWRSPERSPIRYNSWNWQGSLQARHVKPLRVGLWREMMWKTTEAYWFCMVILPLWGCSEASGGEPRVGKKSWKWNMKTLGHTGTYLVSTSVSLTASNQTWHF